MNKKPRILIVEDSAPQSRLYEQYLKGDDLDISVVTNGSDMQKFIKATPPDLILLDYKLPDMDGLQILQWMKKDKFNCFVIVITAHSSVDVAVDMMRSGANDFLEKPVSASRLKTSVKNLLERARLQSLLENYQNTFERKNYHGFIGSSLPMQAVYRIIDAAAPSKATVFITGESGTGKEVCAEAIHAQGSRAKKSFVALNCGAIPHDLMESEIFGHVKGAFTGAVSERQGAASQADGGSLFLDEICEMNLDLQTKLLRFIQTGTFKKVGSNKLEKVDIRFICATNRDPLDDVAQGKFREDLYYRLHVLPIQLPPLRERGSDIIEIATRFLTEYSQEEQKAFVTFSAEVKTLMTEQYDWPGNVRQLQNVIRNIVVLHNDTMVQLAHLPAPLNSLQLPVTTSIEGTENSDIRQASIQGSTISIRPLAQVEKETIETAINFCDGNIPKAAALLDVSPSTIYRKKQSWE
ncbi:sigma-54-dependent Fis family transcriptional regulator [Psychromonas sp. psych-6C06]|uniref:sigma-54-dependent transcriptional regulator n=1 Tax=Psychromonas sp. psych-6C06 TaxID=2058089 RepID=UPI000C3491E1|nr:sigma-54 dependent transcriptional regulator [Psychromonas sp. psych-6C06]PKF62500.1 sigma-54-dependent Fis family transcriptional regulator [Psychromonas sp. psych-6C06]